MNIIMNVYKTSSTHFLDFGSRLKLTVLDPTDGVCGLNRGGLSWVWAGGVGGVGVNEAFLISPVSFALCQRFRVKNGGLLTFSAIIYGTLLFTLTFNKTLKN